MVRQNQQMLGPPLLLIQKTALQPNGAPSQGYQFLQEVYHFARAQCEETAVHNHYCVAKMLARGQTSLPGQCVVPRYTPYHAPILAMCGRETSRTVQPLGHRLTLNRLYRYLTALARFRSGGRRRYSQKGNDAVCHFPPRRL